MNGVSAMVATLMALSAALPAAATPQAVARTHGEALWRGERPLAGQIAGHAQAMPAAALRCINCHGGGPGAAPGGAPGSMPPR